MKGKWSRMLLAILLIVLLVINNRISSLAFEIETTPVIKEGTNSAETEEYLLTGEALELSEKEKSGFLLSDWTYTLNSNNKVLTLQSFVGTETNLSVCLPAYITVDGTVFRTEITSATNYSNEIDESTIGSITDLSLEEGFILPEDCTGLFKNRTGLKTINLTGADASNVTSMSQMFYGCTELTAARMSGLATKNVTSMYRMFFGCTSLLEAEFAGIDTQTVTSMYQLFHNCNSIIDLDLSSFNCVNVDNMGSSFTGCNNLNSIMIPKNLTVDANLPYTFYDIDGVAYTRLPLNMTESFMLTKTRPVADWSYRLDDETNTITLITYIGAETNVCVPKGFTINGRYYTTVIDSDTCYYSEKDGYIISFVESLSFEEGFLFPNNLARLFADEYTLTSVDLKELDSSGVLDLSSMFLNCRNLKTVDLSGLDTSNITNMSFMFSGCNSLTSLDLSHFDMQSVVDAENMLAGCRGLKKIEAPLGALISINLPGVYFDDRGEGYTTLPERLVDSITLYSVNPLTETFSLLDWEYTSDPDAHVILLVLYIGSMDEVCLPNSVSIDGISYKIEISKKTSYEGITSLSFEEGFLFPVNCNELFKQKSGLKSIDFTGVDTSKTTSMSEMFYYSNCKDIDLRGFDTSNVTDFSYMFKYCTNLSNIFLDGIDTTNVTNMSDMFASCYNLISLDVSGFDTSNVTDMGSMFSSCSHLTSLDVSGFDTGNVTNMGNMFSSCSNLISLDVSGFDTGNVTNMNSMFCDCSGLTSLDVSGFDTKELLSMSKMFSGCYGLTNLDVSGFDTSKVYDMDHLFAGCSSLSSLDVSGFDTSNVQYMGYMFCGCSGLTSLDVSGFDTSKVLVMWYMFDFCSGLKELDLSGFDTSSVMNMESMFNYCTNLEQLDLSSFDLSELFLVDDAKNMLTGCNRLTKIITPVNLSIDIELPSLFYDEEGGAYTILPQNTTNSITLYLANPFSTGFLISDWKYSISSSGKVISLTRYIGTEEEMRLPVDFRFNGVSAKINISSSTSYGTIKELSFAEGFSFSYSCFGLFGNNDTLLYIDLSNVDTSRVADMSNMFANCKSLERICLTGLDTSNVTKMDSLFASCECLSNLDLSSFDMRSVYSADNMFMGCSNLQMIDVPLNVNQQISLPNTFFSEQGGTYTSLPKNVESSFRIYRRYTITWIIDGNTETDEYLYSFFPVHSDPVKDADGQYTYAFSHWEPEIAEVTGDATYTAVFTQTINRYRVVFQNDDGTILQDEQLDYGAIPEYKSTIPTKAATAQYTYAFDGWTPDIEIVTRDIFYTATYRLTTNKYTISWLNEGTVLKTEEIYYGEMPVYTGATPVKEGDAQFSYIFDGWSPEIQMVTEDASYSAVFKQTLNKYRILFVNEDDSVLQDSEVYYGELPEYKGEVPTKPATAQYTYTFSGWDHEITAVIGDATYKATYAVTVNQYQITFVDEDGETVLDEQVLDYGAIPVYQGKVPTKPATAQYTYTFSGWDPEITAVIGDATYKATYAVTVNQYQITFVDEDGETVLDEQVLDYGAIPVYQGKVPTKPATAQYTYTFSGWEPEIVKVTRDAKYRAKYTEQEIVIEPWTWTRLAGDNRYHTAVMAAQEVYEDHFCTTIIIASGQSFPDALSGAALAGVYGCPILLTNKEKLSPETKSEIQRLATSDCMVLILGGTGTVSETVENSIKKLGVKTERIAGSNRETTAQAIYEKGKKVGGFHAGGTVILSTGYSFADALSISPYAYASRTPILLAKKDGSLSSLTKDLIRQEGFNKVIVIGGVGSVSEKAENWLKNLGIQVLRLKGDNRYLTSAEILKWETGLMPEAVIQPEVKMTKEGMGVATGAGFPDALGSVSLLGKTASPLLLVLDNNKTNRELTQANISELIALNSRMMTKGYIFGGTGVVSARIEDWLNEAVK